MQWTYRSSYFNDALNTPSEEQPGYGLLDGSLQWSVARTRDSPPPSGVKNALDKDFILAAYFTPGSGPISVIPDRGRRVVCQREEPNSSGDCISDRASLNNSRTVRGERVTDGQVIATGHSMSSRSQASGQCAPIRVDCR